MNKFKAWDNINKSWIHEDVFNIKANGIVWMYNEDGDEMELDATICRSTGKYFADDTQLYENDILKSLHFVEGNKKHYMYHIVKWSNIYDCWMAINRENYNYEFEKDRDKWSNGNLPLWVYFDTALEYEICGNVFENAELLEGK